MGLAWQYSQKSSKGLTRISRIKSDFDWINRCKCVHLTSYLAQQPQFYLIYMRSVWFNYHFIQATMYAMQEELDNLDIGQPVGLPISEKSKNRLYLSWRNKKGQDCKMIGPETKCFCNHKFKDHNYLSPNGKKAPCTSSKCKCKTFDYIPSHGAYDFKCLCKHSFKEHDCITRECGRSTC